MKRRHDPQPPLTWRDFAAWIESEGDLWLGSVRTKRRFQRRAALRITQLDKPFIQQLKQFLAKERIPSYITRMGTRVGITRMRPMRKILHRTRGFFRTLKWRARVKEFDEFTRVLPERGPRARVIFPEEVPTEFDFQP